MYIKHVVLEKNKLNLTDLLSFCFSLVERSEGGDNWGSLSVCM